MKAILASEMRELDRRAIDEFGVPGDVLMERAGRGVAEVVHDCICAADLKDAYVQLFAGRGNNGGDAYVAARHLKTMGFSVEVFLAGEAAAVTGDAREHLMRMRSEGIALREFNTLEEWEALQATPEAAGDVLVDALLGTGISGPARGPAVGAIEFINRFAYRGQVVAVDVPSGLNSDTGVAEGSVVKADLTVTMGMPKRGLVAPAALDVVGGLEVIDIGIPVELSKPLESPVELITPMDVAAIVPRRSRSDHKGTYGQVLIVGGAAGYSGAVAMAAMAALRSGVGLVSVLTPTSVSSIVAPQVPEAMVHGGAENDSGSLAPDALERSPLTLDSFDAVLVGPGMTTHADTAAIVRQVLASAAPVVVLDADALNMAAASPGLLSGSRKRTLLTPHPGEMARLLESTPAAVQQDRFGAALQAAERFGATVVLKGAGTIVAQKGAPLAVNLTGNPGMASGGMGDVLGGLMAGLAAQGLAPRDAAQAAVYLHGRAGDMAASFGSQAGMIATDVIDELPHVFRYIRGR